MEIWTSTTPRVRRRILPSHPPLPNDRSTPVPYRSVRHCQEQPHGDLDERERQSETPDVPVQLLPHQAPDALHFPEMRLPRPPATDENKGAYKG